MQKVVNVVQRIQIIVELLDDEGHSHHVVVNSIDRPVPVPYEQ